MRHDIVPFLRVRAEDFGQNVILAENENRVASKFNADQLSDEFDDDDLTYSKLDDNNYVFEGKTALKDFYKIIKVEDEIAFEENKGEAETIAGFVLEISKNFPKLNSKINFKTYIFTIEALDKKRIKFIKFTKTE